MLPILSFPLISYSKLSDHSPQSDRVWVCVWKIYKHKPSFSLFCGKPCFIKFPCAIYLAFKTSQILFYTRISFTFGLDSSRCLPKVAALAFQRGLIISVQRMNRMQQLCPTLLFMVSPDAVQPKFRKTRTNLRLVGREGLTTLSYVKMVQIKSISSI